MNVFVPAHVFELITHAKGRCFNICDQLSSWTKGNIYYVHNNWCVMSHVLIKCASF